MACSTAFLKKINKRFERWSANSLGPKKERRDLVAPHR